jgi:CHAT domain-containing protein
MSVCQTGLNQRSQVTNWLDLLVPFLYSCVPSVVVSFWLVKADSTRELMVEFYKLLKNGMNKSTALQKAQKKIMEKSECALAQILRI